MYSHHVRNRSIGDRSPLFIKQSFFNRKDFSKIFLYSFPITVSLILTFIIQPINISFIGRLQNAEVIAAVGIANLFSSVIWITTFNGFNGALETLGSQAFGQQRLEICGRILNRGFILLTLIFIPCAVLLWFVQDFLLLFDLSQNIIAITQSYLRWCLPGYYF